MSSKRVRLSVLGSLSSDEKSGLRGALRSTASLKAVRSSCSFATSSSSTVMSSIFAFKWSRRESRATPPSCEIAITESA